METEGNEKIEKKTNQKIEEKSILKICVEREKLPKKKCPIDNEWVGEQEKENRK